LGVVQNGDIAPDNGSYVHNNNVDQALFLFCKNIPVFHFLFWDFPGWFKYLLPDRAERARSITHRISRSRPVPIYPPQSHQNKPALFLLF